MNESKVINELIDGLISGKLKPKAYPKFQDDFEDQGSFDEDIIFEIEKSKCSIEIEFTWNYKIHKGMISPSRDIPNDSDEIMLTDIYIDKIILFDNYYDNEYEIKITSKLEEKVKKYLGMILPVDKSKLYNSLIKIKENTLKRLELKQIIRDCIRKI